MVFQHAYPLGMADHAADRQAVDSAIALWAILAWCKVGKNDAHFVSAADLDSFTANFKFTSPWPL